VSVAVELDALRARVDEFGAHAYLVTVGEDRLPHVVSVVVTCGEGEEADRLLMRGGRRTGANLAASPAATLLWPPAPGGAYSLIVDGTGEVSPTDEGAVAVRPSAAILHRVAGAPGEGPSCLPVGTSS
jgi:hypothetical protein